MKKIYQSFLLRMWISHDAEETSWQASLEDPHTRHIVTFHSEKELIQFIRKLTNARTQNFDSKNSKADKQSE